MRKYSDFINEETQTQTQGDNCPDMSKILAIVYKNSETCDKSLSDIINKFKNVVTQEQENKAIQPTQGQQPIQKKAIQQPAQKQGQNTQGQQ